MVMMMMCRISPSVHEIFRRSGVHGRGLQEIHLLTSVARRVHRRVRRARVAAVEQGLIRTVRRGIHVMVGDGLRRPGGERRRGSCGGRGVLRARAAVRRRRGMSVDAHRRTLRLAFARREIALVVKATIG